MPEPRADLAALIFLLTAMALPAQTPEPPISFDRDVVPVLKAHCHRCHGEKRGLGKLRLHRRDLVFDAKGHSKVIVPGRPEESVLYQRLLLPEGDRKRMPRKSDPLSPAELEIVRRWIAEGASWPAAAKKDEGPPLPTLDSAGRAARDAALARLVDRGAFAARLGDSDAVQVNLSVLGRSLKSADIEALAPLAPSLVRLDLSRSPFDDALAARLPKLPVLRRLDLGGCAVTDAALAALAASPDLEWLNLYGTKVTDRGLDRLAAASRLKRLYLWNTAVTDAGMARFKTARPACVVDRGGYAKQMERLRAARTPVNRICPVMKQPVDTAFTLRDEGRVIGFCCEKCQATFKKDPAAHRAAVKVAKAAPPPADQ